MTNFDILSQYRKIDIYRLADTHNSKFYVYITFVSASNVPNSSTNQ